MPLKDLIHDIHGPSDLKPSLQIFLAQMKEKPREVGWHPSEFAGMCARERIIRELLGIPGKGFKVTPKLRRIFDVGTALHQWYQDRYFGPMGILWGKWACIHCEQIVWGFMPKGACQRCRRKGWTYREVPVKEKLLGFPTSIVGHSDGLLKLPGRWCSLEIKTINSRGFGTLYTPKTSAELQGQIYGNLICQGAVRCPSNIVVPKPSQLIVWYICKDNSEEKEFTVDLDSTVGREQVSQPLYYEIAKQDKELPPRLAACVNQLKKPAYSCDMCSYCFWLGGISWSQLLQMKGSTDGR